MLDLKEPNHCFASVTFHSATEKDASIIATRYMMFRTVIITAFICSLAAYSSMLVAARFISATRASATFRVPLVVPDVLHPPTPNGIQSIGADTEDPEQRPGLFQGDIAIDPVSHSLWKVGLRKANAYLHFDVNHFKR